MPVDHKGTAPGLAPQAKPDNEVVNMKCRNPKCPCITATKIKVPRPGQRVYRCTKCGYVWAVSVGGSIDI